MCCHAFTLQRSDTNHFLQRSGFAKGSCPLHVIDQSKRLHGRTRETALTSGYLCETIVFMVAPDPKCAPGFLWWSRHIPMIFSHLSFVTGYLHGNENEQLRSFFPLNKKHGNFCWTSYKFPVVAKTPDK